MSKSKQVRRVEPPIALALVLVCEKCGRRVGGSGKNPSHQLASRLKHLTKHEFERGAIRTVLTSCMNVCPKDTVAICIAPTSDGSVASFFEADVDDIEESSKAVSTLLRQHTQSSKYPRPRTSPTSS